MKSSIYTTALQYGHDNFFRGVKYHEIKVHVEGLQKKKFDYHSERAFLDWFIQAFRSTRFSLNSTGVIHTVQVGILKEHQGEYLTGEQKKHLEDFKQEYKFYITGESDRKYLEYQELLEARRNSRQAFIMALFAIVISILSVITAPFFNYLFEAHVKPLLLSD